MRRLALFWVVLVVTGALWAGDKGQPQKPEGLPPYGPLKPTATPVLKQTQFSNGLAVWLLPRAGYPKVTFLLTFRGGLAVDPQDKPGIADFLAAAIDQGATTRSALQIAEQVQAAGGEFRAQANADALSLHLTVLASRVEPGLALLADVAQNAAFPDAEVELTRAALTNSWQRRQSDATFMARRALAAAIFGDHPYAVIGPNRATLATTTAADLRREYARRCRPDQALLLVIGDFNPDQMMTALQQRFGEWGPRNQDKLPEIALPKQANKARVFVVPRPNSVQTRFFAATLGPTERDPDYAAASIAIMVYDMRVSRNVREDKGYAYSSGAEAQLQRQANLLVTAAAVRNAVTGASWNEMSYEMNRMATTVSTSEEVERVRHFLIGYDALNLQTQAGMAARLSRLWLNGLPAEQLGREGEDLEKVTAADVERIGRKYFPASQMTVVAVGDEKTIKEQLSAFGVEIKTEH